MSKTKRYTKSKSSNEDEKSKKKEYNRQKAKRVFA
jgi:hypothetical protein